MHRLKNMSMAKLKKLNPFAADESRGNFPDGQWQPFGHFRQRRAIHQAGDVISGIIKNPAETADRFL